MKKFNIKVNGTNYEVEVEEISSSGSAPAQTSAPAASPAAPKAVAGEGAPVKAPMPGTINKVNCSRGASVKKGDILIVLEAMKMENEILAPQDGTVTSVTVSVGDSVNSDDILVTIG